MSHPAPPDTAPVPAEPKRSPLHDRHVALGAAFTDFGGWQMPVRYASDLAEHHAVRAAAAGAGPLAPLTYAVLPSSFYMDIIYLPTPHDPAVLEPLAEAIRDSNRAVDQLNDATRGLQTAISRFKTR